MKKLSFQTTALLIVIVTLLAASCATIDKVSNSKKQSAPATSKQAAQ